VTFREEVASDIPILREQLGAVRNAPVTPRGYTATPVAHMDAITQLCMYSSETHPALISGGRDGVVKVWK
jgi:hypothetical protein